MAADHSSGDRATLLRNSRPGAAVDNCKLPNASSTIGGIGVYDAPGPCRDRYKVSGDPRIAAGAPITDDIIKCSLKPLDSRDYEVQLTNAQIDRLERIFPNGVCDYSQFGAGQVTPANPDRSYQDDTTPGQEA
jgi:hypothetical protein